MSSYPMTYEVEYIEPRSRLTVLFRAFLVIPHAIEGIFLGIALFFTIIAAWFAVVITGRYPQGLYDFNAGVLRWSGRFSAYAYLQADPFPPFGLDDEPSYPVRVRFAPPLPQYSRLLAFFRIFLLIIPYVVLNVMSFVLFVAVVAAWFVQVITGKQPRGLHDVLDFCLAYTMKTYAYAMLLTEKFPPFSNENPTLDAPGYEGGTIGAGAGGGATFGSTDPGAGSFAPPSVDTTKRPL